MKRDPYGRGGNGDADPYYAHRHMADRPGRPDPRAPGSWRPPTGAPRPHSHRRQGRAPQRGPSSYQPVQDPQLEASRLEAPPRQRRSIRPAMPLWQELPLLLVVAFCLAVLIRTFLFQAFFIPSGSMQYTLEIGDRVLVNKIVYDIRQPAHGEIVVFRGPGNWAPEAAAAQSRGGFLARLGRTIGDLVGVSEPSEKDFIKRVIGLPGDTVACCDVKGRVTVNGYPLDEPYVTDNSPLDQPPTPNSCGPRRFGPVTIRPGEMWVMGDHRAVSQDSRCQGPVPIKNVIGRAFVIVWPTAHWTSLSIPKTFEKIPQPFAAARPGRGSTGDEPGGQAPSVPHPVEAFAPIVWILSHRRVRSALPRPDNVGSTP